MMVRVVEKPGFAKKYAFVAVNFGSIDTKFRLNGVDYATPDGVAHYLEHKMFDLPECNAMELFAQNAGSNNAFTSYAMTAYYVECTEHFEENLSIQLRQVTPRNFSEESVENLHFPPQLTTYAFIIKESKGKCNRFFRKKHKFLKIPLHFLNCK